MCGSQENKEREKSEVDLFLLCDNFRRSFTSHFHTEDDSKNSLLFRRLELIKETRCVSILTEGI